MKSLIRNVILLLTLSLLSQLTRYSNQLQVGVFHDRIEASSNLSAVQASLQLRSISRITATLQKATLNESGINQFQIEQNNKLVHSFDLPEFYLFGADWLGKMKRGSYPNFISSFGDWTMEPFRSEEIELYQGHVSLPIQIKAGFLGRGVKTLHFYSSSGKKVSIDISDGFIDNAMHICEGSTCPADAYTRESPVKNLLKILNFVFECLIAAVLLNIVFLLCQIVDRCFFRLPILELQIGRLQKAIFPLFFSLHFLLSAYCAIFIFDSTPHIPDSAVYYRQAVLLSHGLLSIPNFDYQPLDSILPNGAFIRDGNLYFHYNHFWPLLLAIALKLNLQALFLPILSCFGLLLTYRIAGKLFDNRVALSAVAFYSLSPFMIVMNGDFMNHVATSLLILGALYLTLLSLEKPSAKKFFGMGFLLAYALGIRQLTTVAVAFAPMLCLLIHYRFSWRERKLLWVIPGAAIPIVFSLFDNHYITGSAWLFPHQAYHGLSVSFKNFSSGLNGGDSLLGYLPTIIFSFPWHFLFLGLCCLPFLRNPKRADCLLLAIFSTLYLAYLFTDAIGLHGFGPRFLYEALFALFILAARGVVVIWDAHSQLAKQMLGLIVIVAFAWNLGRILTVLPRYENYNGIDTRVFSKLDSLDLEKTILTTTVPYWSGLDIGVRFYDPSYTKTVFIKELPDRSHEQLFRRYPGREIIRVDGDRLVRLGSVNPSGEIVYESGLQH